MARPQSSTSVCARIIAIIKSAGQGATVEEVRMWGDWTHTEKQNLAVNIDKAYRAGLIDRHKVDNTGGAKRAKVFCYTAKGACPFDSDPPPAAVAPTKPLRADYAAEALANPPRGRSTQVPSLGSAPNPNARKPAPLFACGDAVAVRPPADAKPDVRPELESIAHQLREAMWRIDQLLECVP
jgi:hypothetical protein